MIANAHSTTSDWLTVSQVAQEFSVHPMTVRRATNSGRLQTATTSGGHRRIHRADVYEWLGISLEETSDTKPVLIVTRVSSAAQKGSLVTQREECEKYAAKHYPGVPITYSERIPSGVVLHSKEVLEILQHLIDGSVRCVVINWQD